jgi:hypothetical protein
MGRWAYRARGSRSFGPRLFGKKRLRWNWTQSNPFSSLTVKFWRWSWNSRTRTHRVDTPGPGSFVRTRGKDV